MQPHYDDDNPPPPTNLSDAFRVVQMGMHVVPEDLAAEVYYDPAESHVPPLISLTGFGHCDVPATQLGLPLNARIKIATQGAWVIGIDHAAYMLAAIERIAELLTPDERATFDRHLAEGRAIAATAELRAVSITAEVAKLTPEMFTEGDSRHGQSVTPHTDGDPK